jgi:hypothetical protein
MMSLFSRPKAAPAQKGKRANGTNRNTVNEAQKKLAIALNNIASQHVNKYANAIRASAKANANAARTTAVAVETPTPTNVTRAVNAVKTANAAQQTVNNAAKQANNSVNALIKNISNTKFNTNNRKNVRVNNIKRNSRYSNVEENRIQAAIANRRKMIAMFN